MRPPGHIDRRELSIRIQKPMLKATSVAEESHELAAGIDAVGVRAPRPGNIDCCELSVRIQKPMLDGSSVEGFRFPRSRHRR